jgi:DNA-binding transcriptional regulator YbjK
VIGTQGVKAVSHRSVATEAGVPLGSTTYYFASKDEILTETLRLAARREVEQLQRQVEEPVPAAVSPDALVEAILDWLDGQLSGDARFRLVGLYSLQLESVHRPELRSIYEQWTAHTVHLAHRLLQTAGALQPALDAPLLVAALDGLRHNQLATRDSGISHTAARPVVARLVAAALPPPA